jgi:hypothetical protein
LEFARFVSPSTSTADESVGTTTGETDLAVDADGSVIVVGSYLTTCTMMTTISN